LKTPITKKSWWSGSGIGPEFKPQYHTHTHNELWPGDVDQWQSACSVCTRPWVQCPALKKNELPLMICMQKCVEVKCSHVSNFPGDASESKMDT
jgi:hypothetical protein